MFAVSGKGGLPGPMRLVPSSVHGEPARHGRRCSSRRLAVSIEGRCVDDGELFPPGPSNCRRKRKHDIKRWPWGRTANHSSIALHLASRRPAFAQGVASRRPPLSSRGCQPPTIRSVSTSRNRNDRDGLCQSLALDATAEPCSSSMTGDTS